MANNQKIINYVLLALNVVIVAAAESIGNGTLFFERGVIHGIAILFIVGVAASLLKQYYFADPILKKFFNSCLIAFAVFSASHAVEFFSYRVLGQYGDYLFALTLNFYLMSLLIMIAGSEVFLRAYSAYKRSWLAFVLSDIAIVAFVFFSVFLFSNTSAISLEPAGAAPYLYSLAVLAVTFFLWKRITRLTRALSRLADFFHLLIWMVAFVAISALSYSLYEIIEDFLRVPEYQVVYFSHFIFYGGLSLMFVAFQKLAHVGGGVIEDIKRRGGFGVDKVETVL